MTFFFLDVTLSVWIYVYPVCAHAINSVKEPITWLPEHSLYRVLLSVVLLSQKEKHKNPM